jgi:hypothetical protein
LYSTEYYDYKIKEDEMGWDGMGWICSIQVRDKRWKTIFVENSERKKPSGYHRCKYENNIKMEIRLTGLGDVVWINMAQDT